MAEFIQYYRLPVIPDASSIRDQAIANGDVQEAVAQDSEHLLRVAASMAGVSLSLRMIYVPDHLKSDPQSRLRIYLIARATEERLARAVEVLISHGPLAGLCPVRAVGEPAVDWDGLTAVCQVYRRDDLILPGIPPKLNNAIPSHYYVWSTFEPNEENDYLVLDRVLDGIEVPVVIDVCVEPADAVCERAEVEKYTAGVEKIHHAYDWDDYAGHSGDLLAIDRTERPNVEVIRPLRRPDPAAGHVLRALTEATEALHRPQFRFHIAVVSSDMAVVELVGSVLAGSCFENGSYQLATHTDGNAVESSLCDIRSITVMRHECGPNRTRDCGKDCAGLANLIHMASVEELCGVIRPPIGASSRPPCCLRTTTDAPAVTDKEAIALGSDARLGSTAVSGSRVAIWLLALLKHLLIAATSGQGKSTLLAHIARQLWKKKIPFLILETAKKEHRAWKKNKRHPCKETRELANELEVYSVDADNLNPLRFNPLSVPKNVSLDQHIDALWMCLQGAVPQAGSLPALLREGLVRVYEWYPDPEHPPVMSDLYAATLSVLEEKGYSGDTFSDFRGAIDLRLGALRQGTVGRVFQCRLNVPDFDRMLRTPTVVELDGLVTSYQKCLFSLFFLLRMMVILRHQPHEGGLRYVVVLEEAHNILGTNDQGQASEDNTDPGSFVTEQVCRMLAEFRALGVCVIIVDQSPTKLPVDVLKQPGSTMAFRLRESTDREAIGKVMLFGPQEMEEVARLIPGEAYFFTEGYYGPRRIKTTNLHEQVDLTPPSDEELFDIISKERWYQEAAHKRVQTELDQLREAMDAYDTEWGAIAMETEELLASFPSILTLRQRDRRAKQLKALGRVARDVRDRLDQCEKRFLRQSYRRLLPPEKALPSRNPKLRKLREQLIDRLENATAPGVARCVESLERLEERCRSADFKQEKQDA